MLAMPHFLQRPRGRWRPCAAWASHAAQPLDARADPRLPRRAPRRRAGADRHRLPRRGRRGPRARASAAAGARLPGQMGPEWVVAEQLRARGLDPIDVKVVIMTHLHYDHAGRGRGVPAGDVRRRRRRVGARRARAASRLPRPAVRAPFDWRVIDFDDPRGHVVRHLRAHVDLFGDGSVRLLSTPGHSTGHLSVLLRLEPAAASCCSPPTPPTRGARSTRSSSRSSSTTSTATALAARDPPLPRAVPETPRSSAATTPRVAGVRELYA